MLASLPEEAENKTLKFYLRGVLDGLDRCNNIGVDLAPVRGVGEARASNLHTRRPWRVRP